MNKSKASRAILLGGLVAGALDLTYAVVFYGLRGVNPIRIPQSIASGLLGPGSYQGGVITAAIGVVLQFTISLVAATTYYLVSRKLGFLTRRAVIFGLLYGCAIYFFMHLVVLPLSAAPKFKTSTLSVSTDLAVHLFCVGLPIALATQRYSR